MRFQESLCLGYRPSSEDQHVESIKTRSRDGADSGLVGVPRIERRMGEVTRRESGARRPLLRGRTTKTPMRALGDPQTAEEKRPKPREEEAPRPLVRRKSESTQLRWGDGCRTGARAFREDAERARSIVARGARRERALPRTAPLSSRAAVIQMRTVIQLRGRPVGRGAGEAP